MSMSHKFTKMHRAGKLWAKEHVLVKGTDLDMVKKLAQEKAESLVWDEKQFGAGALAGCCEIEMQREKDNGQ